MQDGYILFSDNNKEYVYELIEFLNTKDVNASYLENTDEGSHSILVPENLKNDAKSILSEFFNQELIEEDEILDELLSKKSTIYKKSSEKHSDLKSSGISLIAVSILGIIFIILKISNVIEFDFYGAYNVIFTVLFSVIFIAILLFGVFSLIKAKKIAGTIIQEEEVTDSILNWFKDNYTSELIDSSAFSDDTEVPDYFRRTEYMKAEINNKYNDLDEGYIDSIIEDLYSDFFENQGETV